MIMTNLALQVSTSSSSKKKIKMILCHYFWVKFLSGSAFKVLIKSLKSKSTLLSLVLPLETDVFKTLHRMRFLEVKPQNLGLTLSATYDHTCNPAQINERGRITFIHSYTCAKTNSHRWSLFFCLSFTHTHELLTQIS